jgi:photosystem II stability/assembly factor-like uncharacterized protein
VGIGQYLYRSGDGGASWARSLREIPGKRTPIVHGTVDLSRLPSRPRETVWDLVSVLPDGFGLAVNHEATDADPASTSARDSLANVFRTYDGGQTWREHRLSLSWKPTEILRRWTMPSPVKQFDSLVLVRPDGVVLSWEDPWIHDGAKSHVIYSRDRGESWRYHSLGYTNPALTADESGRLWAQNDGYFLESVDGGAEWSKREFVVEWPDDHEGERVRLLRQVVFVEPNLAFALIVHWKRGLSFAPANVGLVRTTDDGARWVHVHVFDGPNVGDVNERHMLTLEVIAARGL